jgi:DNA-binding XRE family transcriptional regulator
MNRPVRITTPLGEEMVILPAVDYERLVRLAEDATDLAVARAALAEFDEGGEALTDAEMRKLLAAPTPLAFWRRKRGLTQAALAKQAGITQAYLAQIEAGRRAGHVRVHRRLAEALRIDVGRLQPAD